ncbi:MAG: hypothetical protein EOP18_13580, partial [Rhizobiaceae bacterium]
MSAVDLGATLYVPATRAAALSTAYGLHPELRSMVICLEDAVSEANVEDAKTADFHVMAEQRRRHAEHRTGRPIIAAHDVVCHQAVSLENQLERTLALPDPAFATQQQAYAVHVDEDAVQLGVRGEQVVECSMHEIDGHAGPQRGE